MGIVHNETLVVAVDINGVKSAQNQDPVIIVDSRDRDRYLGLTEPNV